MIDQKYLELINKDIDHAISNSEKELLDAYLKTNPEASTMHQELTEIEKLLDKLPDNDPSESLTPRILNSIDFQRYSHKNRRNIKEYFSAAFIGPRRKLTASFAMGLVAGIILLSVIFYASFYNNVSDVKNVLGTMGLSESQVVEALNVNTDGISGKIDIIKAANQYAVYIDLRSSEKYTIQIELDKEILKIDNLAEQTNNSPYSLVISAKESSTHRFLITILREDRKLFERKFSLTN